MSSEETWEALRKWETVRYLVYYLRENFVGKEFVSGKEVIDFSCGLGDLSTYFADCGAKKVYSTLPEKAECPTRLQNVDSVEFRPNVSAKDISKNFSPQSIDVFTARMVFQFPTDEVDSIDVDGMLSQVAQILRPEGRLFVCSHEYTEIDDSLHTWGLPLSKYFKKALELSSGEELARRRGLIELIKTIGIPPREGVHGQTGFGLKALMFVDSLVKHGFEIEECGEIEDFTFPIGLGEALSGGDSALSMNVFSKLSKDVFPLKEKCITSADYADKYKRPAVLGELLRELLKMHSFATIPIFAVRAIKNG